MTDLKTGPYPLPDGPELKIIAFCCNWCAYAAADLAGIYRLSYSPDIRLVRVMCSGMVHPDFVRLAFEKGADGVMVMGCRPGECHYVDGNQRARDRLVVVEESLEELDLSRERFALIWCTAADAEYFVDSVRAMVGRIRELGPAEPSLGGPDKVEVV